jgi:hypothetical protein
VPAEPIDQAELQGRVESLVPDSDVASISPRQGGTHRGHRALGVVHDIRTYVPQLIESGAPGHVVGVASMAALSEVPVFDLAASGFPIGVALVCPGRVATHRGRATSSARCHRSAAA